MDNVHYKTDKSFPFEKITLMTPRSMQGGAFFSKILLENGIPLLFQTPKCLTKNGIIKTGKKTYCDLKLDETHEMFIQWFQTFEKKLHALIFEKKDQWFHNDMTLDDIEYLFNSCIRTYKTKNFLIRCFVKQPKYIKSKNNLQIYDEEENLLQLEDITNEKKIISIIEVLGIKFTNGGASFHLELCMRQLMAFSNKPIFQKCLIHFDNHLEKNREKGKHGGTFAPRTAPSSMAEGHAVRASAPTRSDCVDTRCAKLPLYILIGWRYLQICQSKTSKMSVMGLPMILVD